MGLFVSFLEGGLPPFSHGHWGVPVFEDTLCSLIERETNRKAQFGGPLYFDTISASRFILILFSRPSTGSDSNWRHTSTWVFHQERRSREARQSIRLLLFALSSNRKSRASGGFDPFFRSFVTFVWHPAF